MEGMGIRRPIPGPTGTMAIPRRQLEMMATAMATAMARRQMPARALVRHPMQVAQTEAVPAMGMMASRQAILARLAETPAAATTAMAGTKAIPGG